MDESSAIVSGRSLILRQPVAFTLIAGTTLLIPASLGLIVAGAPTKLCPLPALTIIPAFALSIWRVPYAAVVVPSILFYVWRPALFRGEPRIPRRSYLLVAA